MKSRKKNRPSQKAIPVSKGKRVSGKTGMPPGTLVHIGKVLTESVTLHQIEYNATGIFQQRIENLEKLDFRQDHLSWIEICGLHDTRVIENFGRKMQINPLMLEDILNTEHRPKSEIRDEVLFLTLKAFSLDENDEIKSEQVSFVLGNKFLVSFLENNHPWFDSIKSELINASGRIRQRGLDYILYSLIDIIVDQYYAVIEKIGDQLEDLEEMIFENPDRELIDRNRQIKKEIITIRKALFPTLEAINKFDRDETEMISEDVMRYYDDIHDHIIQILDYVDTYRELSSELKENYLSNLTLRMNKVMKLLTIITTIFIPLSFIAGVYGMNFRNMPELTWKYGYFIVLGLMFVMMAAMLIYFRKKRWI